MAPSVPTYRIANGVVPSSVSAATSRDIPRIGFMGRFSREKGLDWLIPIAKQHTQWQWAFAGDGDLRDLVIKASSQSQHILWDGWVEDLDQWFQNIDVLVQPSWKEGMPYTVIDAMAHRVPVVATRVGAMPEVLGEVDEDLLVSPGDSLGLISAIGYALDHQKLLGASSYHYVSDHLNRDIQLAKVAEVLQSVVGL
jgi:glycosyltransferase involved in cell wall biosynthesis